MSRRKQETEEFGANEANRDQELKDQPKRNRASTEAQEANPNPQSKGRNPHAKEEGNPAA